MRRRSAEQKNKVFMVWLELLLKKLNQSKWVTELLGLLE